jgi:hypothetical protein
VTTLLASSSTPSERARYVRQIAKIHTSGPRSRLRPQPEGPLRRAISVSMALQAANSLIRDPQGAQLTLSQFTPPSA